MTASTTVALVDDQDLVRTGFRMILSVEDDLELVGEASDGLEATRLVADVQPQVVLMDVQMPTMDGIEATRRIVDAGDTKVVILTTFERDDYLFAALEAGASGFLLKSCTAQELVGAIRNVADGHALLAPQMTRRLIERFTAQQDRPAAPVESAPAAELESLTGRERDVLALLAQGLSNAEIAEELVVGTATVKTHVSRILTKLDLRDRVQAVVLAYRTGLVDGPGPSAG
ncbi:MAG TPA: response regulator transcription factor [Nocardioides sp.]|uniref:response regulator transcription factor n=1 Tax=Nocardioides sp. TaxID=35761 RepID=UPI002D80D5E6|nr:response regulator transcription factor [Nocardioides sp.]HET6651136.1 response regulator transcription factor [Nocardioides sp.]